MAEPLPIIEGAEQVQSSRTESEQKIESSEGQREGPNAEKTGTNHNSQQNEQRDNDTTQEERLCEARLEPAGARLQDFKKAHRLSPDFPDSLFELLCTLQEGRRLNDQRCSFIALEPRVRRRCHSEPNTTKPGPRVVFSSMTSLQKEEFFDLVATAQARRLNDQRAQLERSAPHKPKSRSFRGSIKQLSLKKTPPAVPKDELYSMILHTQAQGRLEDQRSRAPGPMDDEVFFSLLLRVQGGRMDEQRTELPCLLHT
ncbi:uncharacterized protein gpsm3 [Eucyclogobius newberryi]|uniref:uncharacterized protein gpsm3 n=1 Tax=Eucyclogobius newberryi TaxID=166745 RepID=UPI003B5BB6FA